MTHRENQAKAARTTGPMHGFARPSEPTDLDNVLEGSPEAFTLEHAIRMAPAGWSFETEDENSNA